MNNCSWEIHPMRSFIVICSFHFEQWWIKIYIKSCCKRNTLHWFFPRNLYLSYIIQARLAAGWSGNIYLNWIMPKYDIESLQYLGRCPPPPPLLLNKIWPKNGQGKERKGGNNEVTRWCIHPIGWWDCSTFTGPGDHKIQYKNLAPPPLHCR